MDIEKAPAARRSQRHLATQWGEAPILWELPRQNALHTLAIENLPLFIRCISKKQPTTPPIVTPTEIENTIFVVRGQRVMLDEDLARLYGVTTSALNPAVKRNAEPFPGDFAIKLTMKEFAALKSQNVMSKPRRGGRTKAPWAFTEHGVAMLSSVLRSPAAIQVNIEIMRSFMRLRRLMATPGELVEQLTQLAQTVQIDDQDIKAITQVLQRMLDKPDPPKRRIWLPTANK